VSTAVDLVTETDKAVEKFVIGALKERYPDYEYISRRYSPAMYPFAKLDGVQLPRRGDLRPWQAAHRQAHVHLRPYRRHYQLYPRVPECLHFAGPVRHALSGRGSDLQPMLASLPHPTHNRRVVADEADTTHMYTAIKNQGSFLTMPVRTDSPSSPAPIAPRKIRLPRKQHPEPLTGLQNALCAVEWGSDRSGHNFEVKHRTFTKLAGAVEEGGKMVHSLRSLGSAALNLCAVAAGQVDLYWEGGCWAWDVAAGWLILTEAGGIIVDGNPGGWTPTVDCRRYLAVRAAPSGQKELVEEFWGAIEGKLEYSP